MNADNNPMHRLIRNRQSPVAAFEDKDGIYRALVIPSEMTGSNEIWDMTWNLGAKVSYHYHKTGHEVFYLTQGKAETIVAGQTYTMEPGDLLAVPPYMPHGFTFLEQDTTWITFFRNIDFLSELVDEQMVLKSAPELHADEAFMAAFAARHDRHRLTPPAGNLTTNINPPLRAGSSLASYKETYFLKVPVWDLGGNNEIWDMVLAEGAQVHNQFHNNAWEVFYVTGGSVDVVLDGERYVARPGDTILVPPYTAHQFTFLEETKWLAFFTNLNYFQALEMRHSPSAENPDIAESEAWRTLLGQFYEMHELPPVE